MFVKEQGEEELLRVSAGCPDGSDPLAAPAGGRKAVPLFGDSQAVALEATTCKHPLLEVPTWSSFDSSELKHRSSRDRWVSQGLVVGTGIPTKAARGRRRMLAPSSRV